MCNCRAQILDSKQTPTASTLTGSHSEPLRVTVLGQDKVGKSALTIQLIASSKFDFFRSELFFNKFVIIVIII